MSWFNVLKDIDSATDKVADMFTEKFENDEQFAKMMMDSILSDIKQGKSMQEVINEVAQFLSSSETIKEFLLDEQFMQRLEPDALSEIDFIKVAEEIVPPMSFQEEYKILKGFLPTSKTQILKLLSDELALPTFLKDLQTAEIGGQKKTMQLLNELQKEGPEMIRNWNAQSEALTTEEEDIAVGNFHNVKLILEKIAERKKGSKQKAGSKGKNIDELYRIFDELKENPSDELYQQAETMLSNNGKLRKPSEYNHTEKYPELVGNIPENYKWLYTIFGVRKEKYKALDDYNCAQVAEFYEIVTKKLLPEEIKEAFKWINNDEFGKELLQIILINPSLKNALSQSQIFITDASDLNLYPDIFYDNLSKFYALKEVYGDRMDSVEWKDEWAWKDMSDEERLQYRKIIEGKQKKVKDIFGDKQIFEDGSFWVVQDKFDNITQIEEAEEEMGDLGVFDNVMEGEEWDKIKEIQSKTFSPLDEVLKNQQDVRWEKNINKHTQFDGVAFIKSLAELGEALGEKKLLELKKQGNIKKTILGKEYTNIRNKLMEISKEHMNTFVDKFKTKKDKPTEKVFTRLKQKGLIGDLDG